MMERQQILATMGELKLYGMKAAFDASPHPAPSECRGYSGLL